MHLDALAHISFLIPLALNRPASRSDANKAEMTARPSERRDEDSTLSDRFEENGTRFGN